jgi:glycosyltransferase 2 family protein
MLTRIRNIVVLLLIIGAFYVSFHGVNFHEFAGDFSHFQFLWLLPALAVYLLGYVIRGFRWVVLLAPIKKCSFKSLFPTLLIGFMANNVTPLRLGEFYRAHLNGKKEGISRSASLGTIILERLFDGMAMLLILGVSVFLRHPPSTSISQNIEGSARLASFIFGAAFLCFFTMLLFKKQTTRLINYLISHAPRKHHATLEKICHTFLDGLQILQSAKESFLVLAASLAAWTCEFTAYYMVAFGFQLAPDPLHYNSAALLMVIVNLGLMVPSTPGGLGVFEAIGKTLLSVYTIPPHTALAYVITVHMLVFIPITLLGYYCLHHEGLNLKTLDQEEKREEKELS